MISINSCFATAFRVSLPRMSSSRDWALRSSRSRREAWDVALYIDGHERPQDPRWLGSVEATRAAYHNSVSTYGLRMPDGLMGDTGAPLTKPEPQPWANWSSPWKPAE
jgi:hypothetical protein